MKILLVLALFGFGAVSVNCEAPIAPYAPSGWRPNGPAFELPTEDKQPTQEYGSPESKAEIEVTEEELQYTGDIATTESTTSFLEYGPPATSVPEEQGSTYPSSEENDLSVQGLPGTEPAAEFRSLKGIESNQRFTSRRNQRFQAQNLQLTRPSSRERSQFRQQQFVQQNQFQKQQVSTFKFNPQQSNARLEQFGRSNSKARALPIFEPRFLNQKQVALDSYGAPAQAYGPPQQEYGPPPTKVPEEEADLPEEDLSESPEETSEEASDPNDTENGSNVAISNAVASGSFEQRARESRRFQNQRNPFKNPTPARLTNLPANEPVYMYNRFGQLIRVL